MNNFLGIDFGLKKIGLAIAPDGAMAFRLEILAFNKEFWKKTETIINDLDIHSVVIGIPVSMSGNISTQTNRTLEFINKFKEKFPEINVFLYDERLTSKEAKKNLPPRTNDDAESARLILQGYLDLQRNANKDIP